MPSFLVRLLIGVLVIWLVQVILGALGVKEPANRILFLVTIIVAVLWILFGWMVPLGVY